MDENISPQFSNYLITRELEEILNQSETTSNTKDLRNPNEKSKPPKQIVLGIVLGFSPGFKGTFAGILSLMFVFYNIMRGIVTWWMSQVRDAEERSGRLPTIDQYWLCFCIHKYFLRWIYAVAIIAFLFHTVKWMSSTVVVPTMGGF